MRARELMVKNVITLREDVSAQIAARMMTENGIGCLVAVDNAEIIGILTERDLLKRVLETCKNPKETKVSEIMTRNVIVGDPEMQLVEATRLMFENKVKKLPIVEEDRLVGLITLTDIARATHADEKTMNLVEALSNMHIMVGQSGWQIDV
jgi:CBS domain-containing protein